MRFDRVRLENFKPYQDADLRLDRGVTVIHGVNGSGKSSLLEACFFALYGARALETTLDEVVTIGAKETTVELWFSHGGDSYHVRRRLRLRDGNAYTAECVLETPEDTLEGATDVRAAVTELLRMDAEAFVNCAYVRQGEVNKLINAPPGDRQDMIDDLLQLGKLETYRERASGARLGVKHVLDAKRELLEDRDATIERLEERNLHGRLNELESERSEVTAEIERIKERREQAVATRDHERERIEDAEEKQNEIESLAEAIKQLQAEIANTEQEREGAGKRVRELRETVEQHRNELATAVEGTDLDGADCEAAERQLGVARERRESLSEAVHGFELGVQQLDVEADRLADDAEDCRERAAEQRETAAELAEKVERREESLAERREELSATEAEIQSQREEFADAPVAFGEAAEYRERVVDRVNELSAEAAAREAALENARESLEEAEELREQGRCPECGQPVEGSPRVEAIAEREERVEEAERELAATREELAEAREELERAEALADLEATIEERESELDSAEELLAERARSLEEERDAIVNHRERAEELEAEAEQLDDEAAAARKRAERLRAERAARAEERDAAGERVARLERVVELLEAIEEAEDDIESLREERERLAELNESRRERLADRRERKRELEAEFDPEEIATARENLQGAEEYIEYADEKLAELTERRDEIQEQVGDVRGSLRRLEELRKERESLADTVDRLESLYEETERLQATYGELRAELRQRNVATLERLLNETFDLVYQNDSYARIELDGEYGLTVYQKDGKSLDPEQLSGGERALFNLSLRCAIYRLLAEGIDGTAPMPPLILDEPTVFLDSGHVSKLLDLVERMREAGVEQIVVVSHDEELVAAADDLVRVEKEPTSNRSSVERTETLRAD